jgi:pyruvate/2-oxoglutarate dehydrogenase complex dihydrolipoamide dehydrogenase (E3) component
MLCPAVTVQVMMATGRVPKIQGLGLEEVGVKLGKL